MYGKLKELGLYCNNNNSIKPGMKVVELWSKTPKREIPFHYIFKIFKSILTAIGHCWGGNAKTHLFSSWDSVGDNGHNGIQLLMCVSNCSWNLKFNGYSYFHPDSGLACGEI